MLFLWSNWTQVASMSFQRQEKERTPMVQPLQVEDAQNRGMS